MKSIQQEYTENVVKQLIAQWDEIFIEGLRLKGYKFNDRHDVEIFLKEGNCRCEDNQERQERLYYVKEVPFLLHSYKVDFKLPSKEEPFKIEASYGHYKYL
jgi:hypothetical protein